MHRETVDVKHHAENPEFIYLSEFEEKIERHTLVEVIVNEFPAILKCEFRSASPSIPKWLMDVNDVPWAKYQMKRAFLRPLGVSSFPRISNLVLARISIYPITPANRNISYYDSWFESISLNERVVKVNSLVNIPFGPIECAFIVQSFVLSDSQSSEYGQTSLNTVIEFAQPKELHTVKFLKELSLLPFEGFHLLRERLEDSINSCLKSSSLQERFGGIKSGGIVVSGPSQCGKRSLINHVVMQRIKVPLFYFHIAELSSFLRLETETDSPLSKLIRKCKSNTPCCILFEGLELLDTGININSF